MSRRFRNKCEHVIDFGPIAGSGTPRFCDKPSVAGYEADGGGWMALCEEHVGPHKDYAVSADDIRALEAMDIATARDERRVPR